MPEINFKIDKTYLAYHTINVKVAAVGATTFISDKKARLNVEAFQEEAKIEDSVACTFLGLGGRLFEIMTLATHNNLTLEKIGSRTERLLLTLLQDKTFTPVLDDTTKALEDLKKDWLTNYDKSLAIMTDLTGIDFNRDFDVFVTHPCQAAGHNNNGRIFTTYRTGFPFYNTVYLWHEILHSYIKPKEKDSKVDDKVSHAIIQLITDNELRVQLGGGIYPPFEGHPFLQDTMTDLLPAWKKYLAQKAGSRDINSFVKEADSIIEKVSKEKADHGQIESNEPEKSK